MKTHLTPLTADSFIQFIEEHTTLPPELTIRKLKNYEEEPMVVIYYEFQPKPPNVNTKRDFVVRFYPKEETSYIYPQILEYPELMKIVQSFCLLHTIYLEDFAIT